MARMIYYLYKDLAEQILKGKGKTKISLDLGLTVEEKDIDTLRDEIGEETLKRVRDNTIHVYDGKQLFKLATFNNGYYALKMIKDYPTLEINGIRMHVFSAGSPFDYAKRVVELLNIEEKDVVLETCFGQGYITRLLAKKAKKVVSYEISPAVLDIAEWNPYSKELFKNPHIEIINSDINEEIMKYKGEFTKIIHDPPSMRVAEALYSRPFYKALRRAAKKGALLYHYIGSVKEKKGYNIEERIRERLEETGWHVIKYNKRVQGIVAKAV